MISLQHSAFIERSTSQQELMLLVDRREIPRNNLVKLREAGVAGKRDRHFLQLDFSDVVRQLGMSRL
jgi:hypothetical protein